MDKRIGAQLFTCRDYCKTAADLEETMRKVREIGYKTVQISGIGADITGSQVKQAAENADVEIVCTHRSFVEYTEKLDETIKLHLDMGCNIAGLGMMPADAMKSKDELFKVLEKFNVITKKCAENGITFGYHNHAYEFAKLDGKHVLDYIIENTDSNLKLILDTHWVAHAGLDTVKVMEKYADRIAVMHYKDKKVDGNQGVISEIGEGNLDWDAIIDANERLGIRWAMVEQDNNWTDDDPFKSLEMSYKFLTNKGFI